jgi:DDE family transposase
VKATGWLKGLEVTADGTGIVSHAGLALLRALADRRGLTGGLSKALASDRLLVHDRGQVMADLACAIADGAEVISDFRVMADQHELFGLVALVPTCWRALSETAAGGGRLRARMTVAVNAARRRAWVAAVARHGTLAGVAVADRVLEGVTCIRLANHLDVLGAAITALPLAYRRRLMVTCDGVGASHGLIDRLDALASRPGHELVYSVGWELGGRERTAIRAVPGAAWQIAIDGGGEVRERRAGQACPDRGCAHRRCWAEEACVAELTGLLRDGPGGDQLDGWPATMRVFARRERPHPGAQLSLFEAEDGWRYRLWVTNLPATVRGWRANLAYIDAAHRVRARVEDGIRTGKDTGLGKFPSHAFALNQAWLATALIAATLLAWLRLLALDGPLAKAEPKTLRYRILHAAGRLARSGRRRRLKISANWPWAPAVTAAWDRITALPQAP